MLITHKLQVIDMYNKVGALFLFITDWVVSLEKKRTKTYGEKKHSFRWICLSFVGAFQKSKIKISKIINIKYYHKVLLIESNGQTIPHQHLLDVSCKLSENCVFRMLHSENKTKLIVALN